MTFQEIRIIATDPCIANQLRDVDTICRRSWYIAAHIWKIYNFKIEVVPFIITDILRFNHCWVFSNTDSNRIKYICVFHYIFFVFLEVFFRTFDVILQ